MRTATSEKQRTTSMLRRDHDKIRSLFKAFEDAKSSEDKQSIVENTLIELTIHSTLEEEIFYPAVREEAGEGELMDEAEEQHHIIKILIVEIAQMEPDDERYDAKFKVLAENVKHHLAMEESHMLSKAERMRADTDLYAEVQSRREELLDELYRPSHDDPSARWETRARPEPVRHSRGPRLARV